MNRVAKALERSWYAPGHAWWPLAPLAWLFGAVVAVRRLAYRHGWLKSERVAVPVLVIGNITVGGAGKTPLTLAIVERLQRRGRCVGVVARGYGGRAPRYPLPVTAQTPAAEAGDEPALLARATGAAVAVDPDRPRAARWLIEHAGVDFIVADDGLQHYALQRDAEIAVTDARRGLGNGHLLPLGPLREPARRLQAVDLALVQGADADFWLEPEAARALSDGRRRPLAAFAGQRVHAVAGIGDPQRFFDMLRSLGVTVVAHPMPDHHVYTAQDIDFDDDAPVLMTEKDAVKCRDFADDRHWAVPVATRIDAGSAARIDALLERLCAASKQGL